MFAFFYPVDVLDATSFFDYSSVVSADTFADACTIMNDSLVIFASFFFPCAGIISDTALLKVAGTNTYTRPVTNEA